MKLYFQWTCIHDIQESEATSDEPEENIPNVTGRVTRRTTRARVRLQNEASARGRTQNTEQSNTRQSSSRSTQTAPWRLINYRSTAPTSTSRRVCIIFFVSFSYFSLIL